MNPIRMRESEELISTLIKQGPFNMFLGAGISKRLPAGAPTWKEMLNNFLDALFDKMSAEGWSAAASFESDAACLSEFGFRPETFWELVVQETSLELVCDALRVVSLGLPNLNHRSIAHLSSIGSVANIATTNFDEYIEPLMPQGTLRIVTEGEWTIAASKRTGQSFKNCYFKVHGTISSVSSLRFTLTHTDKLPTWKAQCLRKCLDGRPLLVAGYSGNDDDVRPALLEIVSASDGKPHLGLRITRQT